MKKWKRFPVGLVCTVLAFVLLLAAAWGLVDRVDETSEEEQLQLVYDAVRSALVTCYATEGSYPSSLEYLKTHYGLAYDESRFLVFYDAFASNILPDIRVLRKDVQGR